MLAWLGDVRSYIPPVQIGEVMRAIGLGIIMEAGEGNVFAKGDLVSGAPGHGMYGCSTCSQFLIWMHPLLRLAAKDDNANPEDSLQTL